MITVKNYVVEYKIEDLLSIDDKNLKESLLSQPTSYAAAAFAHYQSYMQSNDLKLKKNEKEAKIDEKIRNAYCSLVEGAPDAKSKQKLTEAQISAKIQVDPDYVKHSEACNEADAYLKFAENMLEAMKQRKEAILALLAHQ